MRDERRIEETLKEDGRSLWEEKKKHGRISEVEKSIE